MNPFNPLNLAKKAIVAAKESKPKSKIEIAHEVAQKNAALPIEQGGLGLPPNNTYADRAMAQGYIDFLHGTQRLDRFLEKKGVSPKRATSGPMPYGTPEANLASNYAMGKQDTSRALSDVGEVKNYFQVAPKDIGISGRSPLSVEQSWYFLPPEKKAEILEKSKRVGYENLDEFTGPFKLHPEGTDATLSSNHFDWVLKNEARGNPLHALREMWHDSGQLINNPEDLAHIYRLAGYDYPISQNNAPWTDAKGVFLGKAKITNPLDTSNVDEIKEIIPALKDAFKRNRSRLKVGVDPWHKEGRYTPKDWVNQLESDINSGNNSYVWTSIPDKVTDELKKLGYNGILDISGKGGGESSTVVIPFYPEQVRSRFAAFDPAESGSSDLLKKDGGAVSQDAMHMAVMNQKVQKKAGGDLVEEAIKEAKSKQEAPVDQFAPKPILRSGQSSKAQKTIEEMRAEVEANRRAADILRQDIKGIEPREGTPYAGRSTIFPEGIMRDVAESAYRDIGPSIIPAERQWKPSVTVGRQPSYVSPANVGTALMEAGSALDLPSQLAGEAAFRSTGSPLLATAAAYGPGMIGPEGYVKGSKALANEAAYRIYQAIDRGEGALAPMLAGVAPKKMIPAWHGSPHDIPMGRSMLMEKIGTGEGAQAYGHGLYVAEGKNVAKSYAAANKGRAAASEGWIDSLPKYKQMDVYNILQKQYPQQVKDAMLEDARLRLGEDVYAKVKERLNSSNLYKLELSHPDPAKEAATPLSPNDFLHWDLPLSQQPEHIRNAWGDFVQLSKSKNPNIKMPTVDNPNLTGASLVSGLSQSNRGGLTQNETSEFLRQRGIPGIRYLDAGSRGAGEGTYNYVLFDPKLANIVGKEKEGGVIHKAEGGITSDDLIIEENPL